MRFNPDDSIVYEWEPVDKDHPRPVFAQTLCLITFADYSIEVAACADDGVFVRGLPIDESKIVGWCPLPYPPDTLYPDLTEEPVEE